MIRVKDPKVGGGVQSGRTGWRGRGEWARPPAPVLIHRRSIPRKPTPNAQASLDFYTRVLGMTLISKLDFPEMVGFCRGWGFLFHTRLPLHPSMHRSIPSSYIIMCDSPPPGLHPLFCGLLRPGRGAGRSQRAGEVGLVLRVMGQEGIGSGGSSSRRGLTPWVHRAALTPPLKMRSSLTPKQPRPSGCSPARRASS
jgi:catechol 2,3-dioxygenase-like lactoylglutathione lyase family enzyme